MTCASNSRVFDWTSSGLARPEKRSTAKRLGSVARSVTFGSLGMGRVCRVHALGMVAHVEIPAAEFKMPVARLALAINAFLPDDISVLAATRVPDAFHARFHASCKQYRHSVWNHPAMNPFLLKRAWHFPVQLDLVKMRAAAKLFIGRHDFRTFAGTRSYEMTSNVRTLTRCDIKRSGPQLTFIIEGDGFLYKMCRGIVGTLVQVGQGKFPPEEITAMLAHKDRRVAGMTAPAHGLVLWRVYYGGKSPARRPAAKARSRAASAVSANS